MYDDSTEFVFRSITQNSRVIVSKLHFFKSLFGKKIKYMVLQGVSIQYGGNTVG